MKVNTSDLVNHQLDWAVALCLPSKYGGPTYRLWRHQKGAWVYLNSGMEQQGIVFRPTFVWNQGGPIIEREKIDLFVEKGLAEFWGASVPVVGGRTYQYGPTPLVAAMRAFVSSKLGDGVDIPDELV